MSDGSNAGGVPGGEVIEEALLAELRAFAARQDPIPPSALAAARSAIAWRTIDAQLAELNADLSSDPILSGVRGAETPTLLTFESADLTVEVEVREETAGARDLVGQLVPRTPGEVEVRHRGGTSTVQADKLGRFRADGVEAGPLSLRCTAGSRVVETDWFIA